MIGETTEPTDGKISSHEITLTFDPVAIVDAGCNRVAKCPPSVEQRSLLRRTDELIDTQGLSLDHPLPPFSREDDQESRQCRRWEDVASDHLCDGHRCCGERCARALQRV